MFCYSNEINRLRSKDYALFNRWTRSLLLKRVFKSLFDESDFKLKELSFSSFSSVTTVSSSFNSDSFVLKKKVSETSSLKEELWIVKELELEENDVERETSFRFCSR